MALSIKPIKMMTNVWLLKGLKGYMYVTKNLTPNYNVYGERLINIDNVEYRVWEHKKSKLASAMTQHIKVPSIKEGSNILYLGASSGTTVSHISDMIGPNGTIYAIEFSPRPARDLYNLSKMRENIIPIIADARKPQEYAEIVDGVDLLFSDVAQPDQSSLFIKNAEMYLKKDAQGFIAIKTRSISQREKINKIFQNELKNLEDNGFKTIKSVDISRFHRAHYAYLGQWNK